MYSNGFYFYRAIDVLNVIYICYLFFFDFSLFGTEDVDLRIAPMNSIPSQPTVAQSNVDSNMLKNSLENGLLHFIINF